MPRSAEHRERARRNKAAERQRKKANPQQESDKPFHRRQECITTHCEANLTAQPYRMRCKHRICRHCALQLLRMDVNRTNFCFRLCQGYLQAQICEELLKIVMAEKFHPWMGEDELAPPSATEQQKRQSLIHSKRIAIGNRVCQDFTVQYRCEGSQKLHSRKQTFYAKVLEITEEAHLRVRWERSEFDEDTIQDQLGLVPARSIRRCKDQRPGPFL